MEPEEIEICKAILFAEILFFVLFTASSLASEMIERTFP